MPELLLALSGSALVQCPTVPWPKGKTAKIKQDQTILCLTSLWHTELWWCSAMARRSPLTHSSRPIILLPAAQSYFLALLSHAQLPVLATSLIFTPTTWSCSYGPFSMEDMFNGSEQVWYGPTSWMASCPSLVILGCSYARFGIDAYVFSGSLVPTKLSLWEIFMPWKRYWTLAVLSSCQTLQLNCWISPRIQGTWAVISAQLVHFLSPLYGKDYTS